MNRALSVLFVFVGLVVLSSAQQLGPCAPPQFFTEFILTMSNPPIGIGEHGMLAIDFGLQAFQANVSGIATSNSTLPETFQGTFLFTNGTGYWITGGDCVAAPFSAPSELVSQCFPNGGNFSNSNVGTIPAVTYWYGSSNNATIYTYEVGTAYPISLTYLNYQSEAGAANSTSIVYFNGRDWVNPGTFDVPSECANAKMVRPHELPTTAKNFLGFAKQ